MLAASVRGAELAPAAFGCVALTHAAQWQTQLDALDSGVTRAALALQREVGDFAAQSRPAGASDVAARTVELHRKLGQLNAQLKELEFFAQERDTDVERKQVMEAVHKQRPVVER
jgi:hypothetical protein